MPLKDSPEAWYRDSATRALIVGRYLPWLLALNLAWEIAQLPLYTIWRDASAGYVAFAVAHCTVGDLLIGAAALAIALVAMRAGPATAWRWRTIAVVTTLIGVAYTFASEWMNTSLRQSWQYSDLMPTLELGSVTVGLSPLAQWLLVPPVALYVAHRTAR